MITLSMFGLIAGLFLLMLFALRGMSLFIASPLCALIVAFSSGVTILGDKNGVNFIQGYMSGFSGFIESWFFMFLLGSLFGKLMDSTGAAKSLARWLISLFGKKHAILAVVSACAIFTYGGVSVFIVAFSVYPMAFSLFKDADIPHRFIPATLAFGSGTFTMTSAGSQEIQNWIPAKYLGTTPYAAWEVSIVVALFIAVAGFYWLSWMVKHAKNNGETFLNAQSRISKKELLALESREEEILPHPLTAVVPLILVLLTSFFTHKVLFENALIIALLSGCVSLAILNYTRIGDSSQLVGDASIGALLAIGNTAAVVGFGTVVKLSPAFGDIITVVTSVEGSSLLIAAASITLVAGITGSASGGQTIVLPELAPHYLAGGVDPDNLHRVTALSSGVLDSMPHNGYAVTTIRVICRETHQTAYLPMAGLTLFVPAAGTLLAIFLMSLGM